MNKLILLLIFFLHPILLQAVEFVLFTQPKTATHLLIPILEELTKKKCYWAPEYTENIKSSDETFEELSQNLENFLFNIRQRPWTKEIMDIVWQINQKQKTFLHLHAPYSSSMENYLIEKQCINFFVKRDPRDQIVSLLNHYKYIHFNDNDIKLATSDDEKLLLMIRKESRIQTIHYMNWLNSSVCCVLDFEKLMGVNGGKALQSEAIEEMKKIAAALQLEPSDLKLEKVYKKCYGHGWSFFKGKVGVWKDYFKEIHKEAIKEEIGDLLIQLGYEKDLDW